MSRRLVGDGILLFVTLCWGISFPLVGNAVATVDPSVFVMVRFILAAVILLPFVVMEIKKGTKNVLLAGVVLGALNTVVYVS